MRGKKSNAPLGVLGKSLSNMYARFLALLA